MSEEASFAAPAESWGGPTIDIDDAGQLQTWADKLSASEAQIREAVAQVGSNASDVEEHLKGTRSTTNAELTKKAL